ncbi:MAG: DUF4349 domain-containing protein [Nitrososphaerales archaeon]|nr:DUF4349 domain-containing protein [Nitrososphaerales archaeon]
MNRLEGVSMKALAAGLVAFIVIGGFVLALFSAGGNLGAEPGLVVNGPNFAGNYSGAASLLPFGFSAGGSFATVQTVTMSSTTTAIMSQAPPTVVIGNASPRGTDASTQSGQTTFNQPGNGSLLEFFSNVTMESPSPSALASKVVGLAYSVGGYVAYQSTLQASAYVVIRVPAASYQGVLSQIQVMGNVTGLKSTSDDVTVQYTDLNAMLTSLVAEQHDLLRLINESTSVNSTLAIETQLQRVNSQINSLQSEVLQTQRLINYSTVTVSITKAEEPKPLSMTLSATPKSGTSPVGVTFNAIVSRGQAPYLVNYNFGDGSSQQGQIVVHQYYYAGDYNVTVTATDSKGSVALASALIHVSSPPAKVGFGDFGVTLANLLVRVVEGIAELAVVVVPAALVLAAVVYPLRRRVKMQKEIKQG